MMDNFIIYIGVVVLIVLTLLVILLFISQRNLATKLKRKDIEYAHNLERFNNELNRNLMVFQDLVNNNLNNLNNTTYERFSSMENKVYEGINHNLNLTNHSFSKVMNSLGKIDEAQNSIKSLAQDIDDLQRIFNDKKTRGIYGEIELASLLKNIFGDNDNYYELQYKLENNNIVDCVLKGQEPLNKICVDAKFPLENYNRIFDQHLSKTEQLVAINAFRKNVMKHIKDIHDKYLVCDEVYTIGLMFVPAEAIFAYIYGQFSDIIEYAYQNHVIIVSPTTLMAYVTALKALHIKQKKDDNVAYIQKEYGKLSKEFERFSTRYQALVKDFNKVYADMQNLNITTDKIMKQFELINQVELEGDMDEDE